MQGLFEFGARVLESTVGQQHQTQIAAGFGAHVLIGQLAHGKAFAQTGFGLVILAQLAEGLAQFLHGAADDDRHVGGPGHFHRALQGPARFGQAAVFEIDFAQPAQTARDTDAVVVEQLQALLEIVLGLFVVAQIRIQPAEVMMGPGLAAPEAGFFVEFEGTMSVSQGGFEIAQAAADDKKRVGGRRQAAVFAQLFEQFGRGFGQGARLLQMGFHHLEVTAVAPAVGDAAFVPDAFGQGVRLRRQLPGPRAFGQGDLPDQIVH